MTTAPGRLSALLTPDEMITEVLADLSNPVHRPFARYVLAAAVRMASTDEPTCYPCLTLTEARRVLFRAFRPYARRTRQPARCLVDCITEDASYTAPGYGVTYTLPPGMGRVHVRRNADWSYTVTTGGTF